MFAGWLVTALNLLDMGGGFPSPAAVLDNGGPVFNPTSVDGSRVFDTNPSTSNRVYTKSGNYNQPIQDFN